MADANVIIRTINRAEDAHFILTGMARQPRKTDNLGSPSTADSPAPLSIELFDQAQELEQSLRGWTRLTHEEGGDPLPRNTIPACALFLRERAIWIASTPWADDMVYELNDRSTQGIAMLGLFPKRTQLPEACQCGSPQWAYHEALAWSQCAAGHVASLADIIPSHTQRTFSCAEAGAILEVSPRTVERWVRDQKITAVSGDPIRITGKAIRARRVQLARRAVVA